MTYNKHFVAVIKTNGKILKEDRNNLNPTVYLPFGSEYSILLKNLFSRKAQVKVSIDGQDILDGKALIINGNNEINLERFLTDNLSKGNKLKFIEKTQEISDYRGDKVDDGIVRITYQFEQAPVQNVYYHNYPWWGETVYGSTTVGSGLTRGLSAKSLNVGSSVSDGAVYGSSVNCCFASAAPAPVNDGITVPGSESNQKFTKGSIGILENEIHVITLMLRGQTTQAVKVVEPVVMTKVRCPSCGVRNGNFSKFCANCGTGLQVF